MIPTVLIPVIVQGIVPVLLLLWMILATPRSFVGWFVRLVFVSIYLLAVWLAGLWLALPWYLPLVFGVFVLIAAALSLRRIQDGPRAPADWVDTAANAAGVLAVGFIGTLVATALAGRSPLAGPSLDLAFPLRGGTYLVANGGSRELVNAHLGPLPPERAAEFAGMRRAVDLVRIDRLGRRAFGLLPRDPDAYLIFGDTVYAPCPGDVVAAVDGLEDLPVPFVDRDHMAGNHVMLDCSGIWILLGHLRSGSLAVRPGDSVETGAALGRVGNSGNTNEPHLHIHAQRPDTPEAPLSGEPVTVSFGGKYLWRNARVTSY